MVQPSYDDLLQENQQLRQQLTAALGRIADLEAQVKELAGLLAEARRAGKRQAAPFRQGPPQPNPKTPGRQAGDARKHAGQQENGWQFTMREFHEKSGSSSRISDFAIDVRKVVEMDSLPEYTAIIHKNGEEIIHFLKRDLLVLDDPRYETPRHPRRVARGITSKSLKFNEVADRTGGITFCRLRLSSLLC